MSATHFVILDKASGRHHAYHDNKKLSGSFPSKEQANAHLRLVVGGKVAPSYDALVPPAFKGTDTPAPVLNKQELVGRKRLRGAIKPFRLPKGQRT